HRFHELRTNRHTRRSRPLPAMCGCSGAWPKCDVSRRNTSALAGRGRPELAPPTAHPTPSDLGGELRLAAPKASSTRIASSTVPQTDGGYGYRLLDHLIRPQQQRRRDREAERLGCLEADHLLVFG